MHEHVSDSIPFHMNIEQQSARCCFVFANKLFLHQLLRSHFSPSFSFTTLKQSHVSAILQCVTKNYCHTFVCRAVSRFFLQLFAKRERIALLP